MNDPVEPDSRQPQWRAFFWIAVVIALGIRASRLGESLWYDEVFAWIDYASHGPAHIASTLANPVNHVLNTLLTWASVNMLGDTLGIEVSMRLPAFVASIALIPVMFGFVRELMPNNRAAPFVAAWCAAVLAIPGLEGVESRGYSMMILASAASTWMLVRYLNARAIDTPSTNWKALGIYAIATALGIYAHMVTVAVPIGHALVVVFIGLRTRQWHGLLPIAAAAAITIVLFVPMFDDLLGTRSMYVAGDQGQPTLFGIEGAHALLGLGGAWSTPAYIPGLALVLVGAGACMLPSRTTTITPGMRRAIALGAMGAPVVVCGVLAANSWIYARFTLFLIPVAILLMTCGTLALARASRVAAIALVAAVTIANCGANVLLPPKQPMRDVMQYIDLVAKPPAGRVLVVGLAHPVVNVYAGDHTIEYSYLHGRDFDAIAQSFNPHWIVVMYPDNVDDAVRDAIRARKLVHAHTFRGWGDWGNCSLELYGPALDPSEDPMPQDLRTW